MTDTAANPTFTDHQRSLMDALLCGAGVAVRVEPQLSITIKLPHTMNSIAAKQLAEYVEQRVQQQGFTSDTTAVAIIDAQETAYAPNTPESEHRNNGIDLHYRWDADRPAQIARLKEALSPLFKRPAEEIASQKLGDPNPEPPEHACQLLISALPNRQGRGDRELG